jgi:hypothetical protein
MKQYSLLLKAADSSRLKEVTRETPACPPPVHDIKPPPPQPPTELSAVQQSPQEAEQEQKAVLSYVLDTVIQNNDVAEVVTIEMSERGYGDEKFRGDVICFDPKVRMRIMRP